MYSSVRVAAVGAVKTEGQKQFSHQAWGPAGILSLSLPLAHPLVTELFEKECVHITGYHLDYNVFSLCYSLFQGTDHTSYIGGVVL